MRSPSGAALWSSDTTIFVVLPPCSRELAKQVEALLAETHSRPRGQRLKQGYQPPTKVGRSTLLLGLTRGIDKNLIGIAEDSRPTQVVDPVDDFGRPRSDD